MGEYKNIGIMAAMSVCDILSSNSLLIRRLSEHEEDNTSLVVALSDDTPNEDDVIKNLQLAAEKAFGGSKIEIVKINKTDVYTPPPPSLKEAMTSFLEDLSKKKETSISSMILAKNDNKPFYADIKHSKHQKSKKKRR